MRAKFLMLLQKNVRSIYSRQINALPVIPHIFCAGNNIHTSVYYFRVLTAVKMVQLSNSIEQHNVLEDAEEK